MYKHKLIGRAFLFGIVLYVLVIGITPTAVSAGNETEILNITVGEPTKLSNVVYTNTASVAVSRTGVVAAFYPKPGTGPNFYRTSTDLGRTWSKEMDAPGVDLPLAGGTHNATLRDGGVLKYLTTGSSFKGEAEFRKAKMQGEWVDGWFMLHSTFAWFNDDFTKYEIAPVQVYMPDAVTAKRPSTGMSTWPIFSDKMIQLPNGDLLAAMQGLHKGDSKARTTICVSSDQGHKWRYYATVAYDPKDPNPDLPGQYLGYCEPTIAMMSNGQMICVMRTQYAHPPAEYKPMAVCWSDDQGKTWTKPVATHPHLMNISPTLATLDNGVVACQYGRPGFHVVFSLDNGHTWQDRISFSHQVEPGLTGQFDMIKAGPDADLIESFAARLPVQIICELLGVPMSDRAQFGAWSRAFLATTSKEYTPEQVKEAQVALFTYLNQLIETKKADPQGDILSDLAVQNAADPKISDLELVFLGVTLLVAGHETTVNMIGNGIFALLLEPAKLEELRAHPELIDTAIEELLRLFGPGTEGLLHISQIAEERVEKVTDYVNEGEIIKVKVLDVDQRGRIKLSMKEAKED